MFWSRLTKPLWAVLSSAALSAVFASFILVTPAEAYPSCSITITTSNTTVEATGNGDIICINANNVIVNALGGNDTIIDHGAGNAVILGPGDDTYDGTSGNGATVSGGSGTDTITGSPGNDSLSGDQDDDTLIGGSGNDTLVGGPGNDVLEGNAGVDDIRGEAGADALDGGEQSDTLDGGEQDDSLIGGSADDSLLGGEGNDNLEGSAGDDHIFGSNGNDKLSGGLGNNELNGGPGTNVCASSSSNIESACTLHTEFDIFSISLLKVNALDEDGAVTPDVSYTIGGNSSNRRSVAAGEYIALPNGTQNISNLKGTTADGVPFIVGYWMNVSIQKDTEINLRTPTRLPDKALNITDNDELPVQGLIFDSPGYCESESFSQNDSFKPRVLLRPTVSKVDESGNYLIKGLASGCSIRVRYNNPNGAVYQGKITGETNATMFKLPAIALTTLHVRDDAGNVLNNVCLSREIGFNEEYASYPSVGCTDRNGDVTLYSYLPSFRVYASVNFGEKNFPGINIDSRDQTIRLPFSDETRDVSIKVIDDSGLPVPNASLTVGQLSVWTDNSGQAKMTVPKISSYPRRVTVGGYTQLSDSDKAIQIGWGKDFGTYNGQNMNIVLTAPTNIVSSSVHVQDSKGSPVANIEATGYGFYGGFSFTPVTETSNGTGEMKTYGLGYGYRLNFNYKVQNDTFTVAENVVINSESQTVSLGKLPFKKISTSVVDSTGNPVKNALVKFTSLSDNRLQTTLATDGEGKAEGLVPPGDISIEVSSNGSYSSHINNYPGVWSFTNVTLSSGMKFNSETISKFEIVLPEATKTVIHVSDSQQHPIAGASVRTVLSKWCLWGPPLDIGIGVSETVKSCGYPELGVTDPNGDYTLYTLGQDFDVEIQYVYNGVSFFQTRHLPSSAGIPRSPTLGRNTGTTNRINLRWQADAPRYIVGISRDGQTWSDYNYVPTTFFAGHQGGYTFTGLAPGTQYFFRVAAVSEQDKRSSYALTNFATLPDLPSKPLNLAAQSSSTSTVRLTWDLPETNGGFPISDYGIEFSSDGGANWQAINHTESNLRAFLVTGLSKGKSYLFRASAKTQMGYGPVTDALPVLVAMPPAAPAGMTFSSVTTSSALISWSASTDAGGSAITNYKIETSRDGTSWKALPLVSPSARSMSISGMAPGTTYQVRVSALNSKGQGTPITRPITTNKTVPTVILNPTFSNVASTTVTIIWDLPASNGGATISNFQIQVSSNGTTFTSIDHAISNANQFNVTSLRPGTKYWFKIAALNSVGSGALSSAFSTVTLGNVPSVPTNLSLSNKTTTSFTLSWSAANVTDGSAVRNYLVEYSSNGGANYTQINKPISTSTTLLVTGLKSQTSYKFRVIAVNDVGQSSPSNTLTVITR